MSSRVAAAPRHAGVLRGICAFVVVMGLSGCGGSGNEDVVVTGDDCSYQGPTSLEPGEVTVALHLTSLGHNELVVVKLDNGYGYEDLESFLQQANDPLNERPPWISEVAAIELRQEGGERIGESEVISVSEGTYALICKDYWGFAVDGPNAYLIAELTVATP